MAKVLFISSRSLNRCENITAVYNAWDGEKVFNYMEDRSSEMLRDPNADYDLVITDEFVVESKAPVIMIHHGIAGGKTYGLQRETNSQREKDILKKCSKYTTYALASSIESIPLIAEQCGIEADRVLPFGMPRTDIYFEKSKGDCYTSLGHMVSYLFAPTYRTLWDKELQPLDVELIDSLLTDNECFVVKPHMCYKGNLDKYMGYHHVFGVSKDIQTTPFLVDCSVLVTDYSSVMHDAQVLRRPVVLFAKDKDEYLNRTGMINSYPYDYSSRFCSNEEELVEMCRDAAKRGPLPEDEQIRVKYAGLCDGHATERLVKFMHELLGE